MLAGLVVTSGTHVNTGCCFDYGNSENDCTNPKAFCKGCMEAVYFGSVSSSSCRTPLFLASVEPTLRCALTLGYCIPSKNCRCRCALSINTTPCDARPPRDMVAEVKGRGLALTSRMAFTEGGLSTTVFCGPRSSPPWLKDVKTDSRLRCPSPLEQRIFSMTQRVQILCLNQ